MKMDWLAGIFILVGFFSYRWLWKETCRRWRKSLAENERLKAENTELKKKDAKEKCGFKMGEEWHGVN